MVKLTGALKHPGLLLLPITVIVAETGVIPLFIAVNEGNNPAPVPLAGSPMAGLLLVQVNEEEPINIFCMNCYIADGINDRSRINDDAEIPDSSQATIGLCPGNKITIPVAGSNKGRYIS
jgi:hypothetical protein